MAKFGQYLCSTGVISEVQLEEALSHQSVYGARLGTNLVELRLLTIEQLAEHLSAFHRVRLPPRSWLERPRRAALQKVTRPLVERFRFIPLRLEGNAMHAAVLDPVDPGALDDLRFATGCRIEAYVLPEIWMHDWLLTLFRVPRGIRHVNTSEPSAVPAVPTQGDSPARQGNPPQPGVPPRSISLPIHPAPAAADAPAVPASTGPVPGMAPITMEKLAHALSSGLVGALSGKKLGGGAQGMGAESGVGAPAADQAGDMEADDTITDVPAHAGPAATPDGASPLPEMSAEAPVINGAPTAGRPAPDGASVRPPPVSVPSLVEVASGAPPPVMPDPAQLGGREEETTGTFQIPSPQVEVSIVAGEETSVVRSSIPGLTPSEREPAAVAHPFASSALASAEAALGAAQHRDALLEQAFVIGGGLVRRFGLFIVQQGTIQGAGTVEDGIKGDNSGVLVSIDTPCMLTAAANATEGTRLDPRQGTLDSRLLQLLGDEACQEACLFPVLIKRRVVNVIYASNGSEAVGPVAYAALQCLAEQMGVAYGAIILARKQGE